MENYHKIEQKEEQPPEQPPAPNSQENKSQPGLSFRGSLKGHTHIILKMALSPNGSAIAAPSSDKTVWLWNVETGEPSRKLQHPSTVICVSWSPDGSKLATGCDRTIFLWDLQTGQEPRILGKHEGLVNGVSWSPDGKLLASCSNDKAIRLWDMERMEALRELRAHTGPIESVSWSPDGRHLCSSGREDRKIRFWDVETGEMVRCLIGHIDDIWCVAWSPRGRQIASGSSDLTIRIWNSTTGRQEYALEGHTAAVVSVSFLDDGHLLASLDLNGEVIFWRTANWAAGQRGEKVGYTHTLSSLAANPTQPVMAVCGLSWREINIWDLDFALLSEAEPVVATAHYVNAKAVLLGDSGVGKSGLGIRLAGEEFRQTDSTHGAQFWHFSTQQQPALSPNIQAELTLWDLAGQADYRLVHQLFLNDTDAALLLFDCSDPSDPFRGVPYWAKVLKKQAPSHAVKLLVSARCDVSPVTVDRREINRILAEHELDEYFKTSSKQGEGILQLFQHLLESIPWERLPRTSTPQLFNVLRESLLKRKEAGESLIIMAEIQRSVQDSFVEEIVSQAALDAAVRLLQSQGLVYRLNTSNGLALVLLKPELINQYGSSITQAARNHPLSIGALSERDALTGNLSFSGFDRIPRFEEALVLEATIELLVTSDLCFREMGYLVFPSQLNVSRLSHAQTHPRTEVSYRFSGAIETIYASLVVRLSYTDYFKLEQQWKYTVEFSLNEHRLGFSMEQIEEGTGELEIYFYPGITEFDRVTFIRFLTDHLRAKGINIQEQIRLYCSKCSKEVTNHEAIDARIEDGNLDIPCQYCTTLILIPKSVEELYRRDPALSEKQQDLRELVENKTDFALEQFRADRHQYIQEENQLIYILHLSDLHLEGNSNVYRTQLETDLLKGLGIRRLDYIVLSGDIAHLATEEQYRAAFAMLDILVKRFGLDPGRIVIVPGNHDVNWATSKMAYSFVYKDDLPSPLSPDRYIPAGETGSLLCNELLYKQRFSTFSTHFYRRIYSGQDYPLDYSDQILWIERPENRILFLGLNSCWQLDHHFRVRASINMQALIRALDRLQEGTFDGWLKIAVWHHPITGGQPMNDEFTQLLAVHGFQVFLHGHIHEAIAEHHRYDEQHSFHIVGAGTFGAPAREQVTGIPLQYNLLTFDPRNGEMTVNTRKKEKPDGAWSADARWGDKNSPKPSYSFQVSQYKFDKIS